MQVVESVGASRLATAEGGVVDGGGQWWVVGHTRLSECGGCRCPLRRCSLVAVLLHHHHQRRSEGTARLSQESGELAPDRVLQRCSRVRSAETAVEGPLCLRLNGLGQLGNHNIFG